MNPYSFSGQFLKGFPVATIVRRWKFPTFTRRQPHDYVGRDGFVWWVRSLALLSFDSYFQGISGCVLFLIGQLKII